MHGIDQMCGDTKYCPQRGVSVDVSACYDECSFFQKWSDDPDSLPECWWDWQFRESIKSEDGDAER
jgi:hypothetical protein